MIEWLCAQGLFVIGAILFLCAFLESMIPPLPSDVFTLLFAFLAGQGAYNIFFIYGAVVTGSVGGIMLLYYIGRTRGDQLVAFVTRSFLAHFFPVDLFERMKKRFARRSRWLILINRFLPGMRAVIVFTAGLTGIEGKKVFFFSTLSALVWNLFLVVAGYWVGRTWQQASGFMRSYSIGAALVAAIVVTAIVLAYFKRKKSSAP